ncbi:hypothetical protein HN789_05030 [archaeon]|jgi:hypothetical protein|nr:hypothetical protein [archaeon]MBT4022876.1 hypothetical protein [archaeon]MBT4272523.1 hypothetical protein [archaeon]MBT4460409.1 hypothetical protein [archaeon]MBT4859040.1 hypothetical protein [archaeon]
MRKDIILIIITLLLLPIAFGEIVLHTESDPENGHQFVVNKYYFQQEKPIIPIKEGSAILIDPRNTENTVSQCSQVEFSFTLANPTSKTQTYFFDIESFEGTAYLPQSLIIPSQKVRGINVILEPECKFFGSMNPKIVVETSEEIAKLPLLLHILEVNIETITPNDCVYYFEEGVCGSESYIRFYQGTRYEMDIGELFYDPDGDKLDYSAEAENIEIKIKKNKAIIKPRYDFTGAESVIFYANDGKGGEAVSKTFYFHVLDNGRPYVENFILLNLSTIVGIVILFLLLMILIAVMIRSGNEYEEKHNHKELKSEEVPPPPKPKKQNIRKK